MIEMVNNTIDIPHIVVDKHITYMSLSSSFHPPLVRSLVRSCYLGPAISHGKRKKKKVKFLLSKNFTFVSVFLCIKRKAK